MKKNKKPLIPFNWLPASWGLKGSTRAIAQAEYELTGLDLQLKLLEIKYGDDKKTYDRFKIDLEKTYKVLDDFNYDLKRAELLNDTDIEKQMAVLDVELSHKKITQVQYDRRKADLLEEPWVCMPKINWDPNVSSKTFFELDYNDYFIDFLKKNGYEGTEDEIIDMWLNDVCISISEEINGLDSELITPSRRSYDLE